MGGGLDSRCVGRVYGAYGAVRRHHPHLKHDPDSGSQDHLTYLIHGAESFWEANWFAASQEIPRISRNP